MATQVTLNSGAVSSAGSLKLQTNGTTDAVTIDTSGRFVIGNTSTSSKFEVNSGTNLGGLLIGFNGTSANFYDADTQYFRTGNGTERARIDSSGNLLVGTTTRNTARANFYNTARVINVERDTTASATQIVFINPNGDVGSISTSGSSTSYGTSSDYRLKNSIAPMTGALDKVAALKPVTYKWNADGSDGEGFIAHELAEVCPHAVIGEKDATQIEQYEISPAVPATFDEDGNELTPAVEAVIGEREVPVYQGIDTSFLVATLTAAIQEQQAIIETLKSRIEALETK